MVSVLVSLRLYNRVVQEGSEGVSTRVTVTATNRSTVFRSVLRRIIFGFIRVLYGLFEGDDSAPWRHRTRFLDPVKVTWIRAYTLGFIP